MDDGLGSLFQGPGEECYVNTQTRRLRCAMIKMTLKLLNL